MQTRNSSISDQSPALVFPHNLGPGTRGVTTALLYHEKLVFTLPGWCTSNPMGNFYVILQRAKEKSHVLLPLLGSVAHFVQLAQKHAAKDIQTIEPLGKHVVKIFTVYPGTTAQYQSLEPMHDPGLAICTRGLENPINMCTASVEFVWRTWETALELGGGAGQGTVDPDLVLDSLNKRAVQLGGPEMLLGECSLNRYVTLFSAKGNASYVTNEKEAVLLLSSVGQKLAKDVDSPVDQSEALSFYFFDRILTGYVKPLQPDIMPKLSGLLSNHSSALKRMREKCRQEALELVSRPPDEKYLRQAIENTLRTMEEEASEIAELNQVTMRSYFRQLAQDDKVWMAVAGFLGSATILPEMLSASLAATLFSLMGAKAVRASFERRDCLKSSPWAFVYYAKNEN